MGNAVKGTVTVKFEGKNVNLCLDFNAICEIEDVYQSDFPTILSNLDTAVKAGRMCFKDLRVILWGGMLQAQPDATLVDAGKIAQSLGVDLFPKINELIERSGLFDVAPEEAPVAGNAQAKVIKSKKPRKP